MDVGLLDHHDQRLLGCAPWLQEAREVASFPKFRDRRLDPPGPRIPIPVAVDVVVISRSPVRTAPISGSTSASNMLSAANANI